VLGEGCQYAPVARPSKFIERRRLRVLELVQAGASLREAAKGAGVAHTTLIRWIARGRKAAPGSRFRQFAEEVDAARLGGPELVQLKRRFDEASPEWLQKYLERTEWRPDPPDPPPNPGEIVVVLHDGSPLDGRPADPAS
jgi:hypothetical protein